MSTHMFLSYRLSLEKNNIIQYNGAFKLAGGKIFIVMELAVNDLLTHLEARKRGRRNFNLSLRAVNSIARQALSVLEYLHGEGVTHRDLKPSNILVTNWDAQHDIPTIKLADFGLAGIRAEDKPEHSTFCGTEGYVAPEMVRAYKRLEELKRQRDKGKKTVPGNRVLRYDQSVDIWALGKVLLELVDDVPAHGPDKGVSLIKRPPLRIIRHMMQEDPKKRPTAAECLQDSWIAADDPCHGPLAQKRDRSPTQSTSNTTSSTGQPVQKAIRKAYADSNPVEEGSKSFLMNAMWSSQGLKHSSLPAPPTHGDTEMKDLSLAETSEMRHNNQVTQLTVRLGGTRVSVIINDHGNADPEVSPSMQRVVSKLHAALEAEGYGNNLTVTGNNPAVRVVRKRFSNLNISFLQKADRPNVLEVQVGNEEWTNSFWNELLQRPLDQGIRLGPATAARDVSRVQPFVQGLLDQVVSSLLDEPSFRQKEPIAFHEAAGDTQAKFPISKSDSSRDSNASKGVTYPSNYEDPAAGILF